MVTETRAGVAQRACDCSSVCATCASRRTGATSEQTGHMFVLGGECQTRGGGGGS